MVSKGMHCCGGWWLQVPVSQEATLLQEPRWSERHQYDGGAVHGYGLRTGAGLQWAEMQKMRGKRAGPLQYVEVHEAALD